jgi:hypothetical protein
VVPALLEQRREQEQLRGGPEKRLEAPEKSVGTPIEALVDEGQKRGKAPRASMIPIAEHCATVIRWKPLQAIAACSYITVKASA